MIEHHSHIGDISIRANLLYKGNLILVHFKGLWWLKVNFVNFKEYPITYIRQISLDEKK